LRLLEKSGSVVIEKFWLPPRDSNPDMLIQSPLTVAENKENQDIPLADRGKVLQNPHHPRTKKDGNG